MFNLFRIFSILFLIISSCGNTSTKTLKSKAVILSKLDLERTKSKSKEALQFCQVNKYNIDFCILVDMRIHSGLNRFVLWDFKGDSIQYSCLVGHGCGKNPWSKDESKENPQFSNTENSHLSALGKYRLGERGYSDWGIHIKYLMHGLEKTNNNALKRAIVFHSWDAVSESEIYPNGTSEGWGCPTISNLSMKLIDPIIKNSTKPVLFWIFN